MAKSMPSALVTDQGRRVKFRLAGEYFDVEQSELRTILGVTAGAPGLGITIDDDQFHFEFVGTKRPMKISAAKLRQRLVKLVPAR